MKGHILCIEDDQDSREMLLLFLQNSGYEVMCAVNGEHALNLVTQHIFDLLLIDNWMPDMNGVELTRTLRQAGHDTPIVFYSGAGAAREQQEALDAGAQGYLLKPTGIEELIQEIEKHLETARNASSNRVPV